MMDHIILDTMQVYKNYFAVIHHSQNICGMLLIDK